jgi:hypothetical protein
MAEWRWAEGAVVARRLTADEYSRLGEIDVLGEKVELIDGRIIFGRYPFVFSAAAVAAAREAGVELAPAAEAEAETTRGGDAPFASPAAATAAAGALAREHWHELERLMLILVQEGGASLTLAASWCGGPDEALGGMSPAAWLEFGRDSQVLFTLARRDAARLRQ